MARQMGRPPIDGLDIGGPQAAQDHVNIHSPDLVVETGVFQGSLMNQWLLLKNISLSL